MTRAAAPMSPAASEAAAGLPALLDALRASLTRLLELSETKLHALRSADAPALQRCASEESAALEEWLSLQRRREVEIARLAQGLPTPWEGRATLSALAERLPATLACEIRGKTGDLRALAAKLQATNRAAAELARGLHSHIRAVFQELARSGSETAGYGRSGQLQSRRQERWVDALG